MNAIASRAGRTSTPRKTKTVVTVAAAAAIAAFALGPVLFTPAADLPAPSSAQLPFFIVLAGVEALIFGAGVAFAFFGRSAVRRLFSSSGRVAAVHLAITWALVSWWPHDNFHMANGANLTGLLVIEYAFHVTMIVAAAVVVWALIAESRGRRA
ncbi:MAG TPA: hypothetical protein VML96_02305 [Egibacteraceae bacterium]|nr:hypothetical protein [Egibacteraceae bacterium]